MGRRAVKVPRAPDLFADQPAELVFDDVEVTIAEHTFRLTGDFERSSRQDCEAATTDRGGSIRSSVSKTVDYLVVGQRGGAEWRLGSWGPTIEKAVQLRMAGVRIKIVKEEQWARALDRANKAMASGAARVPSIAAQVWRALRAAEDERYEKDKAEHGRKARRRHVPKPIVRTSKGSLCHRDQGFLELTSQYDYELLDRVFVKLAESRGVLQLAGLHGSRRWEFFANHQLTKADYLLDPYFHLAVPHEGQQHRFTDAELESNWGVILYGRAALQDCWEVYVYLRDSRASIPNLLRL